MVGSDDVLACFVAGNAFTIELVILAIHFHGITDTFPK